MEAVEVGKRLKKVKAAMGLLFEQRSSAAIQGLEGDNRIIADGERALEELEVANFCETGRR